MTTKITNYKYNEKDHSVEFQLQNIDISYVVGLRRLILSSIPLWGIKGYPHLERTIKFDINTTKDHNELISKTLSMIPINLTEQQLETMNISDYEFQINEQNKTTYMKTVTSKDIKIYDKKNKKYLDDKIRDQIFPANKITGDNIIIINLNSNFEDPDNGEHLKLSATAVVSNAIENASYQQQMCYYNNAIDKSVDAQQYKEVQELIKLEPHKKDIYENNYQTLQKYRNYKKNEYGECTSFDFYVESYSQSLKPEYFVKKGFEIMMDQVDMKYIEFKQEGDKKIKLIYKIDSTFTIPNIVQKHFIIKYIRGGKQISINKKQNTLKYVGQHIIHYLEKLIVQDFEFESDVKVEDFKVVLETEFDEIKKNISQIKSEWIKISK